MATGDSGGVGGALWVAKQGRLDMARSLGLRGREGQTMGVGLWGTLPDGQEGIWGRGNEGVGSGIGATSTFEELVSMAKWNIIS